MKLYYSNITEFIDKYNIALSKYKDDFFKTYLEESDMDRFFSDKSHIICFRIPGATRGFIKMYGVFSSNDNLLIKDIVFFKSVTKGVYKEELYEDIKKFIGKELKIYYEKTVEY